MKRDPGRLDPPLLVPAVSFDSFHVDQQDRKMIPHGSSPQGWENGSPRNPPPNSNLAIHTLEEATQPTCSAISDGVGLHGGYTLNDSWGLLLSESASLKCTFRKTTITVGRDPFCDIVLDDPRVSQIHFAVAVAVEVDIAAFSPKPKGTDHPTPAHATSAKCEPPLVQREGHLGLESGDRLLIGDDQYPKDNEDTDSCALSQVSVESHGYNNLNHTRCEQMWDEEPHNVVNPFDEVEDQNDETQPTCEMNTTAATNIRFRVVLTDHSTNGTFVNDIRVGRGRKIELQTGFDIAIVRLHEKRNNEYGEDDRIENIAKLQYKENDANIGAPEEAADNACEVRNSSTNKLWSITNSHSYLEHFFFHPYPTPKSLPVTPSPPKHSVTPELSSKSEEENSKLTEIEEKGHSAKLSDGCIAPGEEIPPTIHELNLPSTEDAVQQKAKALKLAPKEPAEPSNQIMRSLGERRVLRSKKGWTKTTIHPSGNFFMPITPMPDLPRFYNQYPPASAPSGATTLRRFVNSSGDGNLAECTILPLYNKYYGAPSYVVMPLRKIQWGNCIGSGANSDVYLGIDILTGMMLAVKVLKQVNSLQTTSVTPDHTSSSLTCHMNPTLKDFEDDDKVKDCKNVESGDSYNNAIKKDHEQPSVFCSSVDTQKIPCGTHEKKKTSKEAHCKENRVFNSLDLRVDDSIDTTSPATTRKEETVLERPESEKVKTKNKERICENNGKGSLATSMEPTMASVCTFSQLSTLPSGEMVDNQKEPGNGNVQEPLEMNSSADPVHYQAEECQVSERTEEDYCLSNILDIQCSHIRELCALSKLRHQRIVQCLGFQQDPNRGFCIIMEYVAGGTLQSLIKCFGAFEENVIRLYTVQILEGLEYLKSCNVVHGDLKSANILVSDRGNVKLADFGTSHITRKYAAKDLAHSQGRHLSSNQLPENSYDDNNEVTKLCGTPLYMSPELIRTQVLSHASDIWALGCIVYEMATGGILPWREVHHCDPIAVIFHIGSKYGCSPSLEDIYKARTFMNPHTDHEKCKDDTQTSINLITQNHEYSSDKSNACEGNELVSRGQVIPDVSCGTKTPSPAFIDFINVMFTANPAQRPTATELLQHPFISNEHDPDALNLWRKPINGTVSLIQNDIPSGGSGNSVWDFLNATQLAPSKFPLPPLRSVPASPVLSSPPSEAMATNYTKPAPMVNNTDRAEMPSTVGHEPPSEREIIDKSDNGSSPTAETQVASCLPPYPVLHPSIGTGSVLEPPGNSSVSLESRQRRGGLINRVAPSHSTISQTCQLTPIHPPPLVPTATLCKSLSHTFLPHTLESTQNPEMQTPTRWGTYQLEQDRDSASQNQVTSSTMHINQMVPSHSVASDQNNSLQSVPKDAFKNSFINIGKSVNLDRKECTSQRYPSYSPVFRSHVNYIRNQSRLRVLQLQLQSVRLFKSLIHNNNASSKPHQNIIKPLQEDSTIWLPPSYDETMHMKKMNEENCSRSVNQNSPYFIPQGLANTNTLGCHTNASADGSAIYHSYSPQFNTQANMRDSPLTTPTALHPMTNVPPTKRKAQPVPSMAIPEAGILHSMASLQQPPGAGQHPEEHRPHSHSRNRPHEHRADAADNGRGPSAPIHNESSGTFARVESRAPGGGSFLSTTLSPAASRSIGRQPVYPAPPFVDSSGGITTAHASPPSVCGVCPAQSFSEPTDHPLTINDPAVGVLGPVETSSKASSHASPQVVAKRKRRLQNHSRVTRRRSEQGSNSLIQKDPQSRSRTRN
ncbi:unnamed protein product [Phytomonas sp. Hart1]|nr:unnamed protein product [Phytomonas sp. Hart1]|eukprot:CCW66236.1 unnamed protein product [Phytomonas sp. isolate Hart1]